MGATHFGLFKKARWNILAVSAVAFSVILTAIPQHSMACETCYSAVRRADPDVWEEAQGEFDSYIDREFKRVETFIVHQMWEQSILPGMMLATEQLTAVAVQQAMAIGMFIDAENQLNAQRLLQEIHAQAQKDYQPSIGLCEFGSVMKSLAATERRSDVTAVILSQRSLDRQLLQKDTAAMYGGDLAKSMRLMQFKSTFCDSADRASALSSLCSSSAARVNKDIDYFSLIDLPWTLKFDLTNQSISSTSSPTIDNIDDEHVFAMASNLFANDLFTYVPAKLLQNKLSEGEAERSLSSMQEAYMDMRAIVAKRNVAENSFNAIAAMKAEGNTVQASGGVPLTGGGADPDPASSRKYMEYILKELGVTTDASDDKNEMLKLLGKNPSYYAQMEILTKKIYQNPDFYTNLYDTPANVKRKTVALEAIKLMQKFDMLKSFLRGEASTSILLELAVSDLQNEIEDKIQTINPSGL